MTDTIIASLPPEGLRSVLRGLLGVDNRNTAALETLTMRYLDATKPKSSPAFFISKDNQVTPEFHVFRVRYRCLMGCGKAFDSLQAICEVIGQLKETDAFSKDIEGSNLEDAAALIDSDLVQAVTAAHKQLSRAEGLRPFKDVEQETLRQLRRALLQFDTQFSHKEGPSPFFRGPFSLDTLLDDARKKSTMDQKTSPYQYRSTSTGMETTKLGDAVVPRMFMGLWQFSSPAWGTAPLAKIFKDFKKHIDAGFVAYGTPSA